jgi:hypothetical protein
MDWKKIAIRAFAFGFGAATFIALVVAGYLSYRHHEETKPWTSPMKATFTGSEIKRPESAVVLQIDYAIENPTDKDYQLPFDSKIMLRLPDGNGYKTGEQANVTFEPVPFIPSKQKVNVAVICTFDSGNYTMPPQGLEAVVAFINKRMIEMDGFSIFDRENRIRIDFPNEWKNWPDIKKLQSQSEKKFDPYDPLDLFSKEEKGKKTLTVEEIQRVAKQSGLSFQEAATEAKEHGYQVPK